LFAEVFGAVEVVDVDLAELVKGLGRAFAVLPSGGEELDVFFVKLNALLFCVAFPRAVLGESVRVVEDATADHDAVQLVLFG